MSAVWEQLEALDQQVAEARTGLDAIEREHGRARSLASIADSARLEYEAAVAAHEVGDDEEERARLQSTLAEAAAFADEATWQARIAGGRRRVETAEVERDEWGRLHAVELAAEQAPEAVAVRDRLVAAVAEVDAAEDAWATQSARAVRVARFAGLDPSDVPGNPLAGSQGEIRARFAKGLKPPIARSLLGDVA